VREQIQFPRILSLLPLLGLLLSLPLQTVAQAEALTVAENGAPTQACHVDDLDALVECGTLAVPLDHRHPEGESLIVGFVRLPAFNRSGDNPPLFFLAGGPGQAATSLAARVSVMFRDARADRDIVLIDQRGTGRSAELVCDEPEPDNLAPEYDLIDPVALTDCVAELPEGIEFFNTASAIRDFEAVRRHLGYAVVDLYGGSYGSRAAIAYLALAGDAVRAVVLDGVAPPSVPIGLFGSSAARAFERAVARCQSIAECQAAFPDLREQFAAVDARLREGPVETTIPHPVSGAPTTFRLWHGQFVSLLRLTLYAPDSTALLPTLISQAAAGNYLPLAALAVTATDSAAINPVLNLNIVCNEDLPRFSAAAVAADADNSFGGDTAQRVFREACALMPRFDTDLAWMDASDFPQPALLLSGAADPVTPPENGESAVGLFRSAQHVVAPEAAHIVAASDCGGQMIADFLASPGSDPVDSSCVQDMPVQRFRVDAMGTLSSSSAAPAP
jgi:pimeloyl-ACP methyl ester carboxylesterase